LVKKGRDLYIIATGRMVYNALRISERLSRESIDAGVVDLFRIKPLNAAGVLSLIDRVGRVVTLEEHFVTGGVGNAMAEVLAESASAQELKAIGIPDRFCRCYGDRDYLWRLNRIDVNSVTETIAKWMGKKRRRS
jgi:transketolase